MRKGPFASPAASGRGRAKSIAAAALALATLVAWWTAPPAYPDGAGDPGTTEASFDGARARDDLAGAITDPAKEVRITFHATAATKVTATLGGDPRVKDLLGAGGLTLTLCDSGGTDLGVTGSKYDRSNASLVRWKGFPLTATDDYVLIVRAASAGSWRLRLANRVASTRAEETTDALAAEATDDLTFEGLAGGKASWTLTKAGRNSRFVGEAVRIVQPDDTDLPDLPTTAKGTVTLTQDGPHRLVYRNAGTLAGDGRAVVVVKPPRAVKRTIYLDAEGAVLVPVVTKIDPPKAFHLEDALAVTVSGRDFQTGADLRLVRAGRPDIVATSVLVRSESEITGVFDLATADSDPDGRTSVGTWTVGVWNAPVYATADDPTTLVRESPTRSLSKKFRSLSASSITLPAGIVKKSEVWFVDFNDDFQNDLSRMGLSSADPTTRRRCREVVEAYTILFLRDLFRTNETFGSLAKNGSSVPVSFIVARPGSIAGDPGVDYDRIEVGGAEQAGDPHDPAEPLAWGASGLPGSEIDFGNVRRDDLSVLDGVGGRLGLGARTAVLDPASGAASTSWILATAPLRNNPLTAADANYFAANFVPANQAQADRYAQIVAQATRAAREIAAIVAHHVGKAMGAEDGAATGPMSNPGAAGEMWPTTGFLTFAPAELTTLRTNAVPHQLPGKTRQLQITYFPLLTTRAYQLPDCVTPANYSVQFGFVGGRPNAVPADYRVQWVVGSVLPPRQLTLSFNGLAGTVPVSDDGNPANFTCYAAVFRVALTDTVRGGSRLFRWRLDTYPNVNDANFPSALRPAALAAISSLPPK